MSEEFYDKEIAPTLLELGRKCEARGIAFLAAVEYKRGEIARTSTLPVDSGLAMQMLLCCAVAGTNIDSYFIALVRFCREYNIDTSQSMVMRLLTGPEGPKI